MESLQRGRRRAPKPGVDPAERVAVAACASHENPTRVMFLGDVHGQDRWVGHAIKVAARQGAQTIVQLGDFGYWEHERSGVTYLDAVEWHAARHGVVVVFIRGNHDNEPLLRSRYAPAADGFVPVRPHVWWAPDSHRWVWGGVCFVAAGGAYSVDVDDRVEGVDWWPTEELSSRSAEKIVAGGQADVMVTHDCPAGIALGALKPIARADGHRRGLATLVNAVRPTYLVHGHYHRRNSEDLPLPDGMVVHVEGFDCENGFARSWWVTDVADLAS
jgi:hypothetical protein